MANDWTGANPFLGMQNPYLQENIDNTMGDMSRNYNLMVKPNTESAMVGSGSFGNSGLQQMQQNQMQNQQDSMGKVAAGMRMQDYGNQQGMYQWDQGFNRGLSNDAFSQNNQNMQNYMGLMGLQSNLNTADINNAATIQNMPLQYQNQFTNMASGIGGIGGASNQTGQSGSGNPYLGALGGWQLGTQFGKQFGGQ